MELSLRLVHKSKPHKDIVETQEETLLVHTVRLDKPAELDIIAPIQTEMGFHTEAEGTISFDGKECQKVFYIPRALPSEEFLKTIPPRTIADDFCSREPSGKVELPKDTHLELLLYTPYAYLPNTNFSLSDFIGKDKTTRGDILREYVPDIYGFALMLQFVQGIVADAGFYTHSNKAKDTDTKFRANLKLSLSDYLDTNRGELNLLSERTSWPWYFDAAIKVGLTETGLGKPFRDYVIAGIVIAFSDDYITTPQ